MLEGLWWAGMWTKVSVEAVLVDECARLGMGWGEGAVVRAVSRGRGECGIGVVYVV